MERKVYIENDEIKLLFAKEADRKLIYDLSFEDMDVILSMFDKPEDFHWEELRDAESFYFDEKDGKSKYLLIQYENKIVGVFCHVYHDAVIENMEFHIWLRSTKYTGKGIGTKVLNMMLNKINEQYEIDTFLMRPWIKNPRAVKTYEKCGFEVKSNFNLCDYFTKSEIEIHGNGAYSVEETVNMVCKK